MSRDCSGERDDEQNLRRYLKAKTNITTDMKDTHIVHDLMLFEPPRIHTKGARTSHQTRPSGWVWTERPSKHSGAATPSDSLATACHSARPCPTRFWTLLLAGGVSTLSHEIQW